MLTWIEAGGCRFGHCSCALVTAVVLFGAGSFRLQRLEEENQRLLFDMKQYQQSAQSEDENQPNKRQRVASLEKVEALQATIRRLEREVRQGVKVAAMCLPMAIFIFRCS